MLMDVQRAISSLDPLPLVTKALTLTLTVRKGGTRMLGFPFASVSSGANQTNVSADSSVVAGPGRCADWIHL